MGAGDVVLVAHSTRSGVVESIHHGAVVALAADGSVAWTAGNPDAAVYPRSSLKPLQAQAMVGAGLDVPLELLAIACGSHHGELHHVDAVRRLLATAGLDESALQNSPALPLSTAAAEDAIRARTGPSSLLQNCSGKHAAMLATSVARGWPTEGYLDPQHPVQLSIHAYVAEVAGGVVHTGIDGCGAPTAMVSLAGLARAVRHLAVSGAAAYRAMIAHPALVAGAGGDDTELMAAEPGLAIKGGAEGVAVAAHADGRAVALKVADGSGRARLPVLLAALRSLGFTADVPVPAVLGHGRPVGEIAALVP